MTTNKITPILPEPTVDQLKAHILHQRKLHADALQMLIVMGRDLLETQKTLLDTVTRMRAKYEQFAAFIETNSAHLPDVEPEAAADDRQT